MTKQNMTSPGAGTIAHTPIPWRVNADFGEIEGDFGDNAITVAKFFDRATDGFSGARAARAERDVNVELACRAVNSHAALVAALRGLLDADSAICEGTERTSDLAMGRIAAIDAACAALKSAGEQL